MFHKRVGTALAIAAWVLVGLSVVAGPSVESAAGTDEADAPRIEARVEIMHKAFASFSNTVGGLSPEEQYKVDALEKAVALELKADPEKMDHPDGLRDEVLARFRADLTPAHQKQYDKIMNDEKRRRAALATSEHLKQIGVALMLYSRDHGDAMPPDFASMVSKSVDPTIFLVGGATTRPSTVPAESDDPHLAKWVKQNAQFVYMAAGKSFSQLPSSFVVAYVKPADAQDGNDFLLDDGSVVHLSAQESAPVVAELQAGHNPPPALKKIEAAKQGAN